jgi:hypothetical protein
LLLLSLRAGPAVAVAQHAAPATLILTIELGGQSGHDLWSVDRQPLSLVRHDTLYDTLRFRRTVRPGLVAGLSASYAVGSRVGVTGGVHFVGLPFRDSCEGLFYNPEPWMGNPDDMNNREVCDDIAASGPSNGAVAFTAGVVLRARPAARAGPYLRGAVGYASYGFSAIAMAGTFVSVNTRGQTVTLERQVIGDPTPKRGSAAFVLGVGMTVPITAGRHLRMEVRDHIFALERIAGSPVALHDPATETRVYHHLAVLAGFDVVLERRPRRRD